MKVPSLKKLLEFLQGLRSRLLHCRLSKSEKPDVWVELHKLVDDRVSVTYTVTIIVDDLTGFEELLVNDSDFKCNGKEN